MPAEGLGFGGTLPVCGQADRWPDPGRCSHRRTARGLGGSRVGGIAGS